MAVGVLGRLRLRFALGVQPALIPEIFGPHGYGFNYACLQLPNFFGSLLSATLIAGNLYGGLTKTGALLFHVFEVLYAEASQKVRNFSAQSRCLTSSRFWARQ